MQEGRLNQADFLALLTNGFGDVNRAIVTDPHSHDRVGHGLARHERHGPQPFKALQVGENREGKTQGAQSKETYFKAPRERVITDWGRHSRFTC